MLHISQLCTLLVNVHVLQNLYRLLLVCTPEPISLVVVTITVWKLAASVKALGRILEFGC